MGGAKEGRGNPTWCPCPSTPPRRNVGWHLAHTPISIAFLCPGLCPHVASQLQIPSAVHAPEIKLLHAILIEFCCKRATHKPVSVSADNVVGLCVTGFIFIARDITNSFWMKNERNHELQYFREKKRNSQFWTKIGRQLEIWTKFWTSFVILDGLRMIF